MLTYAVISPHPPLLVPEVGGSRVKDIGKTEQTLKQVMSELVNSNPDTVVLLTPHGNMFADGLSCLLNPTLYGDLKKFGRRDVTIIHENDLYLLSAILDLCAEQGIHILGIDEQIAQRQGLEADLDHGALVPLYYLDKAGGNNIPIIVISPGFLPAMDLYNFGRLLLKAAARSNKRIAIIGSGDLSHRLKEEGPYDYHHDGPVFDQRVYELVKQGEIKSLLRIPESLRRNAGECGYNSIVIVAGILDGSEPLIEYASYEGPFGVGYLTAGIRPVPAEDALFPEMNQDEPSESKQAIEQVSAPVRWARMVLDSHIKKAGKPILPKELKELEQKKGAVFVSLKKNHQLRGCIGTIIPSCENLALEIYHNAISAGTRDPRFYPVQEHELDDLEVSVDILSEPIPCYREELDPRKYGVIVRQGKKSGLLLPDLEGVDTVEQQLQIALAKAGIREDEDYRIERFEVQRYH